MSRNLKYDAMYDLDDHLGVPELYARLNRGNSFWDTQFEDLPTTASELEREYPTFTEQEDLCWSQLGDDVDPEEAEMRADAQDAAFYDDMSFAFYDREWQRFDDENAARERLARELAADLAAFYGTEAPELPAVTLGRVNAPRGRQWNRTDRQRRRDLSARSRGHLKPNKKSGLAKFRRGETHRTRTYF